MPARLRIDRYGADSASAATAPQVCWNIAAFVFTFRPESGIPAA
jgi:hypothetical protein